MAVGSVNDARTRTSILLGAPGGIGSGVCETLVAEGWRVVALGRNAGKLADLRERLGDRCEYRVCDAYDPASIEAAIQSVIEVHGRIDGLVNGVADTSLGVEDGALLQTSLETWDRSFASSIRAYFVAARAVLPVMLSAREGSIINISSIGGIRGDQWLTAYSAAKAGIVQLSRSIAAQYGRSGIRCNTVIPGVIAHDRVKENLGPILDKALAQTSAPRLGRPEDVGELVAFLLGSKSGFINGESIVCDGGQTSRGADWMS